MMEDDGSVIYGIDLPARCLAPVAAADGSDSAVQFLVGTNSVRAVNQLILVTFADETDSVTRNVYSFRNGEIWCISPSTIADSTDEGKNNLCAVCYSNVDVSRQRLIQNCGVFRYSAQSSDFEQDGSSLVDAANTRNGADTNAVQLVTDVPGEAQFCMWEPNTSGSSTSSWLLATIFDNHLKLWDCNASSTVTAVSDICIDKKATCLHPVGRWCPHQGAKVICVGHESVVYGFDVRASSSAQDPAPIFRFSPAAASAAGGGGAVRSIDFNPNKPYDFAVAGDDCAVRIFDMRMLYSSGSHAALGASHNAASIGQPLLTVREHSWWIWSVRYNPFHDQLLLSSGSDSKVILNSVVSVSSESASAGASKMASMRPAAAGKYAPADVVEDDDDSAALDAEDVSKSSLTDGVICVKQEHEDSVYAAEWSLADPWIFASISYDGRLVISRVPKAVKYDILL